MYEASKQCERAIIPICYESISLEDVLDKNFDKVLVMAERSCELSLKNYLIENPILKNENVLVVIGPEGGFSQKEFDFFLCCAVSMNWGGLFRYQGALLPKLC